MPIPWPWKKREQPPSYSGSLFDPYEEYDFWEEAADFDAVQGLSEIMDDDFPNPENYDI